MQVVVTGAAGFIGAALTHHLAARGVPTYALVHPRTDTWRLHGVPTDRILRCDLAEPGQVAAALAGRADLVVVHAAARGGHPDAPGGPDPDDTWRDTVLATETLLQVLTDQPPVALIHLGSSTLYTPSTEPLCETSPQQPVTLRGRAKAAASQAVWAWAGRVGVPVTELVIFHAYGPNEQADRMIPTLLDAARHDRPVHLVTGRSGRDLIHVHDVCAAVSAVLERGAYGRRLNVGGGRCYQVPEIVAAVEEVTGRRLRRDPVPHPRRPADVEFSQADLRAITDALDWRPTISLHQGLRGLWDR